MLRPAESPDKYGKIVQTFIIFFHLDWLLHTISYFLHKISFFLHKMCDSAQNLFLLFCPLKLNDEFPVTCINMFWK